jgi:excisionase family DNA binding protein
MDTNIKLINITYLWLSIPLFSHILSNRYLVDIKMTDEILTLKEVADYLKLAEKTAYRLAAESKLPGFKVGGSWRFKKEDILQWIEDKKASNKSS